MKDTVRETPGPLLGGLCIIHEFDRYSERDNDGSYIVTDAISTVYGTGSNVDNAREDWAESLAEYYGLLEQRAVSHPPTKVVFDGLREYVQRGDWWTDFKEGRLKTEVG